MVIVTLRLLIVLQTVPSSSLEVTFTNYINPVVLLMLLSIISPIELSVCVEQSPKLSCHCSYFVNFCADS